MFCSNCGKELPIPNAVCPNCGFFDGAEDAPIAHQQGFENTPKKPASQRQILAKSESCKEKLEAWKTSFGRNLNLLLGTVYVILIVVCFVVPFSNSHRDFFTEIITTSTGRLMIIEFTVANIAILIVSVVASNQVNKQFESFSRCCAAENLIVDTEKVYGSSVDGRIELSYAQISRTQLVWQDNSVNTASGGVKKVFKNDIFVITDQTGKTYTFYSFLNGRELSTVIDGQLARR